MKFLVATTSTREARALGAEARDAANDPLTEEQALAVDMAVHEAKKSPMWLRKQAELRAWEREMRSLDLSGRVL